MRTTNNKGTDMSMYGECEICGEKKKIRSVRNKNACATCEHIWRAANVNPDLVLRTLIDVKGNHYVAGEAGVEPPVTDAGLAGELMEQIRTKHNVDPGSDIADFVDNLVVDVEYLKTRLHATKQGLAALRVKLGIDEEQSITLAVDKLQQERQEAVDSMDEIRRLMGIDQDESILEAVAGLRREWQHAIKLCTETLANLGAEDGTNLNNLPQVATEMFENNGRLRLKVSGLEAIVDAETIEDIIPDNRTATLLDLALDVIAGRVSGLDAERISALR
jgi:hypothetical protein